MTAMFGRDWWPETVRRPWLRLAAGVLAAPTLLTAVATGAAFAVYGADLPDAESVRRATTISAMVAAGAFFGQALSTGLLALAGLWAARLRSRRVFAAAGLVSGAVYGLSPLIAGQPVPPAAIGALAAAGLLMALIARAVAGIRNPAPDPVQPTTSS